ncbi:hypothetical protein [Ruminococcus sp.]|uniref:hypothetical protein n=1 Tax=Ruminococcus sp. TaxID=41978 RepID=UPI0025E7AA72|nr:hypothetical protein [Ruminococcus sp.]
MKKEVILSNGISIIIKIPDDYSFERRYSDEYFSSLVFSNNNCEIFIVNDTLSFLAKTLYNSLIKIDERNVSEQSFNDGKSIGYYYNIYLHSIDEEIDFKEMGIKESEILEETKYILFESQEKTAWIYKYKSKYYFTITPNFLYHFDENCNIDKNDLFKDFLLNYKVIFCIEFSKNDIALLIDFISEYI